MQRPPLDRIDRDIQEMTRRVVDAAFLNTDLSDVEQRIAEHYLRDDPER